MKYNEVKWGLDSIGCVSDIVGKTPIKIETDNDEYIFMQFSDNTVCRFYHEQDCCENVTIEDINGDWNDLIGNPIFVSDVRVSDGPNDDEYDSNTWTFYTFRGIGGSVDVRWHGSSNGYYSESVNFQIQAEA